MTNTASEPIEPQVDQRFAGPCRGGFRHWFTYYGEPGTSAPSCRRATCNVLNPRYRPDADPYAPVIDDENVGADL